MKIAVVSSDGKNVNEHFGKAERFLIYEMENAGMTFVEERPSIPLSINDPDHPFDPERFGKVLGAIRDCKKVFVTQIGKVPAEKLKAEGIEPIIFDGPIMDIK